MNPSNSNSKNILSLDISEDYIKALKNGLCAKIISKEKNYELIASSKNLKFTDIKNKIDYKYNFELNKLQKNGVEQPNSFLEEFSKTIQGVGEDMKKNKCEVFTGKGL